MPKNRPTLASRRNNRRQNVIKTTTIRDFSGGWNVIDNDLNLSSRFSKILTNMLRLKDGSIGMRPGTRMLRDFRAKSNVTFDLLTDAEGEYIVDVNGERIVTATAASVFDGILGTNPFVATNSAVAVVVTHANHGLISGHKITFSGATAVEGIPANELNAEHVIEVTGTNTYKIIVTTPATESGAGGGAVVQYVGDNETISDRIINATYFGDRIIAVSRDGTVIEIDGVMKSRVIWNDDIADAQPDSPDGWGTTEFVSFAVFAGELIICNGIDKPLKVNFGGAATVAPCQYLVDLASGSNAYVPTCRYVVAMPNYLVMAGDISAPGTVYISNLRTSGTWVGDDAPNDAVNVDVGQVVQAQNNIIRGIARFREYLIVAFDDVISFGRLGTYNDADAHVPNFEDAVQQHGSLSHRTLTNLGNDLYMTDTVGVPTISRAQFTGELRPDRVSELIDPEIQQAVLNLTVGASEDRMFSVYDQREGRYMLFIPNAETYALTTETEGFVFTSLQTLRVKAWAKFEGWNWACGFRSQLGRMFFSEGTRLYVMGATEDPIYSDFVNDLWRDEIDDPAAGKPISFVWELPWADFDKRMNIKNLRYLSFDAKGQGRFQAEIFIDNIYTVPSIAAYYVDDGETLPYFFDDAETLAYMSTESVLIPALSLLFAGGNLSGNVLDDPLSATDERLREASTKFKLLKLRMSGQTMSPLQIVSISLAYQNGGIQR